MFSKLLAVLACAALGSCSLFMGTADGQFGDQSQARARIRNPLYAPAGDASAQAPSSTDSWKAARATILKTFAFRALEQGLVDEARSYLQEACEADPFDTASHAALSRLYLAEGNRRASLAYATQAAVNAPDDPEINMVYAAALAENDQADEATRALEHVWKVNAGDPAFAQAMMTHYAATGGNALAKRFVEKVLNENPGQAYGWALAGDVFLSEGNLDEATEAFRKAVEIDPQTEVPLSVKDKLGMVDTDVDPVQASALEAENTGDLEGAERLLRFLATAKEEVDPGIHASLARVLFKQERLEEAEASLAEIPIETRTWRDHLLEAKIAIRLENWDQARSSLLLARTLRPGTRAADLLLQYVTEKSDAGQADDAGEEAGPDIEG